MPRREVVVVGIGVGVAVVSDSDVDWILTQKVGFIGVGIVGRGVGVGLQGISSEELVSASGINCLHYWADRTGMWMRCHII